MRLRTFESFWLIKNGMLYSYPMLQENITVSIVVVGGGITGALISDALVEKGYDVLLLDKRDIAQGSTSATTSMLQYEVDVPLCKLTKLIGEEAAVSCYREGIRSIQNLADLITKRRIDCGLSFKKSLYIAHSKRAARDHYIEYKIRDKYKLGVQWLEGGEVKEKFDMQCYGAILSDSAASVDAYRLAHELIHDNMMRGMKVVDQTTISKFDFKTGRVVIKTEAGYRIKCDKVIFCTGFESTDMLKEKLADLFYTYACISEEHIVLNENLKNTLVWDTANPYFYMRTTDDGRLLLGGEDSAHRISLLLQKRKERKTAKLMDKLRKVMPGVKFIEDYSWAGVFGSTKDGLPYIGKSPEYQNAFFVLGFGGNGITFSVQGRDIVVDLLNGRANELAQYYRFGR